MHRHIHPGPTLKVGVIDPVRSADIPFLFVKGDKGRGSTIGLGRAKLLVIEGVADADSGTNVGGFQDQLRLQC